MPIANIFISAASAEFATYRDVLRRNLTRVDLAVAVQEDFVATGTETLDKLDDYLHRCEGIVHLIGDMTGASAMPQSVDVIRERYPDFATRFPVLAPFLAAGGPSLPYTQWEAWLALYHRRRVIVCAPEAGAARDARFVVDDEQCTRQQEHLTRLASVERFVEFRFADAKELSIAVLRSPLGDLLRRGAAHTPRNLPGRPNAFFVGRDELMTRLERTLGPSPSNPRSAARCCVLSGLGGVGKSRLALEYAWARTSAGADVSGQYTAALFVDASDGKSLDRGLAALAAPVVLDLPEHEAREQDVLMAAVLRWFASHAGWLLVADNVDDEGAAEALEKRLPSLAGGHVLVTSRLGKERWGGSSATVMPVDELAPSDAADFLLRRTEGLRRPQADDGERATGIAQELGNLPLALVQATAYIAQRRLTLAEYRRQWHEKRDTLLGWFDARAMEYPRSVAATWQTSVARLSAPALRLLQRLAWLATEPIPEQLLEVPTGDDDPLASKCWGALAELAALSLVRRDDAAPRFTVHRLVQEVTRAAASESTRREVLGEALSWVRKGFAGDVFDVGNWPRLEPLLPHALAVSQAADGVEVDGDVGGLMNQAALLFQERAMFAQAESLMRRALAIAEARYGAHDPIISVRLNNLGQLLSETNRSAEAEPLTRRALAIDEARYGPSHPEVATDLTNLASILKVLDKLGEAEPLMRRALAIDEAHFGETHRAVATDLSNLAALLRDTDRAAEAEPMMRRALQIDERLCGAGHPRTAIRMGNLAHLLFNEGRLEEAESLLLRALQIKESSFEAVDPRIATSLNNLAQVLAATDRLDEAELLTRRALAIDEAAFGPTHPQVAIDLNNLANLLAITGRSDEAEGLIYRASLVTVLAFGSEHAQAQRIRKNYEAFLSQQGRDWATAWPRVCAAAQLQSRPE